MSAKRELCTFGILFLLVRFYFPFVFQCAASFLEALKSLRPFKRQLHSPTSTFSCESCVVLEINFALPEGDVI